MQRFQSILQFKKVSCKNCYKCVRNCPVKAIRVHDHNPYRHTPSAKPTKISDLPKALGSSLIAPKAALAALATAIPPPTQPCR